MKPLPNWIALGALGALALTQPVRGQDAQDVVVEQGEVVDEAEAVSDADAGSSPLPGAPASVARDPDATDCTAERFVVIAFAPDVDPAFASEVRTDLAAELGPRGLSLCSAGATTRKAAAQVQVGVSQLVAKIELDDHLTHKRVERDLALGALPQNGRALATAIAIDELLRASWAELTLQRDRFPEPDESAREAPREPPEPPPKPAEPAPSSRRLELGAHAGFARTNDDFNAFSLHARASLRPSFGWFVLSAGPSLTLPARTPRGDVDARGAGGALTLGACSEGTARVYACGGARAGVDWLRFRGSLRDRATLVHVSGVAMLAGRIGGRLSLFGEFAIGAMVRGARITDGTDRLAEVAGMLMALQVGLGVEL